MLISALSLQATDLRSPNLTYMKSQTTQHCVRF